MNELARGALQGELIAPGEGLTLVVAPMVLSTLSFRGSAPAGLTLAELADHAALRAGAGFRYEFEASINGDVIARDLWRRVRPKPGTVVLMRAVAGFDDNVIRTLLQIGVLAASSWLAPILAPLIGLSAALVGAAITIGGQMLVNALFPVSAPQLSQDQASQTYSIGGGANTADPFGVLPSILGINRVYPKLAAGSYTEFIGADQYLRMLVVWGYGPLDVSQLKLGETPIESFDDVEIETRLGYADDAAVTLYPNEVVQEDLSVDLTAAGGAQLRTTAAGIDEISIDVVAPGGIVRVDGSGAKQSYEVTIKVEHRAAGSTDAWVLAGTIDLKGRATDAIRTGLRAVVAHGQYDVQLTKTSADYTGSDQVQEQVVWTALRGFRNAPPINFAKPLALTAIRIKATSQLNGAIDTLNGIVKSRAKSFNGAAWVDDQPTNSPADLFRLVLQGPANARPVADGRINIANLERWWSYCRDNGFSFNMVRDMSGSVLDALSAVAAAGRATWCFTDGKWDVVWDDPDAPIVQHFTPRNSSGFSGSRTYVETPHGFRVRFVNAEQGYAQDERIVYDDGYTADNATLFEGIEFPGVTDPALIWKFGRFHIAQARLRPEQYAIDVDFEQLTVTRGDRVRVNHDVAMWGLGAGRVKALTDAPAVQSITIDEPVTMEADKAYAIRFRLADGSSLVRSVVLSDGEQTALTLGGLGAMPSVGDLWMFGETEQESAVMRVLGITPRDDLGAHVILVDDAPAISMADKGAIPAFDSQISVPVDVSTAAPVDLTVTETFAGINGATAGGAILGWTILKGEYPAGFDVEVRDDDGDALWRSAGSVAAAGRSLAIADLDTGRWSFRVRANFTGGTASKWAMLENEHLLGIAGVPVADIQNLRTSFRDNTSVLEWDEIRDPRGERYEIRKGDSWATADYLGEIAHSPLTSYGNGTYWVAAIVRLPDGLTLYSSHPASLAIAGSLLVVNVIATYDEGGAGWTGELSAGLVIDAGVLKTSATGTTCYYEPDAAHIFDVNYARPTRLGATWKSTGEPAAANLLADSDFLNNPDILGGESARFIESWVEIGIAQTGSSDVFAHPDAFAPADVFAGDFVWSDWQKFAPGQYVGRYFKFRLALRSNREGINAVGQSFMISADVPDRLERITGYVLDAAGETFQFVPEGTVTAAPYKGGPDGASLPNVQVTIHDQVDGDIIAITRTLAAMTIAITNAGVGVSRTIDITVQGW